MDASSGKQGKTKIKWTPVMDEAFTQAKNMISQEVFLTYPDWTLPFCVHTNALDDQLGTAISQKDKPIAFLVKDYQNRNTTILQQRRNFSPL